MYAAFSKISNQIKLWVSSRLSYIKQSCCQNFHGSLGKNFQFATSETHFYVNEDIYEQADGAAMGSPLVPVLAISLWVIVNNIGWFK